MANLTPRFSSHRAVHEYTEQYYLPAASAYLERAADEGKIGVDILDRRRALDQTWSALRLSEGRLQTDGGQLVFEVQRYLGCLDPTAVRIELCANGVEVDIPVRQEMKLVALWPARPAVILTARQCLLCGRRRAIHREIPYHAGIAVPLADSRIPWQR